MGFVNKDNVAFHLFKEWRLGTWQLFFYDNLDSEAFARRLVYQRGVRNANNVRTWNLKVRVF